MHENFLPHPLVLHLELCHLKIHCQSNVHTAGAHSWSFTCSGEWKQRSSACKMDSWEWGKSDRRTHSASFAELNQTVTCMRLSANYYAIKHCGSLFWADALPVSNRKCRNVILIFLKMVSIEKILLSEVRHWQDLLLHSRECLLWGPYL